MNKSFKKFICLTLSSAISLTPVCAANTQKSNKTAPIKETSGFFQRHPALKKATIATTAIVGTIGSFSAIREIYKAYDVRDVSEWVELLDDNQVTKQLETEKQKYSDRDKEVFRIDESFNTFNSKTRLIILKEINDIFDAYPIFTQALISKKLSGPSNRSFTSFTIGAIKMFSVEVRALAATSGITSIKFNKLFLNLSYGTKYDLKSAVFIKHSPDNKTNELIESIVAHEMGAFNRVYYFRI